MTERQDKTTKTFYFNNSYSTVVVINADTKEEAVELLKQDVLYEFFSFITVENLKELRKEKGVVLCYID